MQDESNMMMEEKLVEKMETKKDLQVSEAGNVEKNTEKSLKETTGSPVATVAPVAEEELIFKATKKKKLPKLIGRGIGILVLLGVLGTGGYFGYNLFFKEEKTEITIATSFRTTLETKISGSGTANSKDRQAVVGLAKGEVVEVLVEDGDYVEIGQPLYTVDDTELREQLKIVQTDLDKISESMAEIYKEINGQIVYAPFSGKTVNISKTGTGDSAKDKKVGDEVVKGETIVSMVDDSKMRATFDFSIAYIDQIHVGDKAKVSLPNIMALLEGTVESIDSNKKIRDEGIIVFEVTVILDNPGILTKDMVAMAAIDTPMGEAMPADSSKLEYNREEIVNMLTGGKILEMNMKNYYQFQEGDVLCRINNETLAEKLTTAKKSYDEKKKTYDEQATNIKYYTPVAELAGTVTGLSLQQGDKLTGTATVVMNISDLSGMVLDVNIDETDVAKIKVGMDVQIDANGKPFMGKFTKIATEGKMEGYSGMSVFPAKIEIYDTTDLMPGMWMNYNCVVSRIEDCVVVPSNAVKYTEAGTVVFVREILEGMTACEVDAAIVPEGFFAVLVEAGASDDMNIEIKTGLPEGVEVATSGMMPGMENGYMGGGAIMVG